MWQGLRVTKADFSLLVGKGGAEQAEEKLESAVILSAAKNLALPLRVNYAKDLALSVFKAMRDSSFARLKTAAAPQNDSAFGFSETVNAPSFPYRREKCWQSEILRCCSG